MASPVASAKIEKICQLSRLMANATFEVWTLDAIGESFIPCHSCGRSLAMAILMHKVLDKAIGEVQRAADIVSAMRDNIRDVQD